MIIHMLNRMALKQIQAWYLGFMMMWIVEEVEVEVVVMLQDGHGRKMETGCVQIQGLWFDNARPAGAGGTGAVGGRGRGHGGGDTGERACHVGGSMGLFGSNDWPCPMCGNINWAKCMKCNICNTNKSGHSECGVRGGCAGGYKELDEEEIEETRR
nr:PREDICTED: transcription initiation factor TFIID subunit 15-like isoform X1 [Musa acuminata subsp. malaccensis]XP_018685734.1 PREDICTED: transcription initiation factor TFIID subunit 15-like isoform X1 [Musa acuminata subsp. malaccensis]